jgi:hypothetical protein
MHLLLLHAVILVAVPAEAIRSAPAQPTLLGTITRPIGAHPHGSRLSVGDFEPKLADRPALALA